LETGEIDGVVKYENGNQVMVKGGNNIGRVGILSHVEKHASSFDIGHIRDAAGHTFCTRVSNIYMIGDGKKSVVSLPKGKGIKLNISEEREKKISK